MKLSIKVLQEGLSLVAVSYRESKAYSTAEDYVSMAKTLRLIEVEAPHLIKRVEDIWESA